jgi:hypothetical protein
MVPSDPISSLARHRHARHRALQPEAPDASPFCSPDAALASFRINASRHAAIAIRSGPGARNGLSLPCNSSPFPRSIPGSTLPACSFAHRPESSTTRSAFLLRHRSGLPRIPATSLLLARCRFPFRFDQSLPPISTPHWDSCLPPDQSVQPDLLSIGPPSEPARSPLAPRCRFHC